MSSKKVVDQEAVERLATREEVYCDRCGKTISDGRHDGFGGVNWWGVWLKIHRDTNLRIAPKMKEFSAYPTVECVFEIIGKNSDKKCRVLCHSCEEAVIKFIDGNLPKGEEE